MAVRRRKPGLLARLFGRKIAPPADASETSAQPAELPAGQARPRLRPQDERLARRPCPICGGSEFRWGWLESGLYGLGPGPAAADPHSYVKQKTRFGDFVGLRARLCNDCGHVDAFTTDAVKPGDVPEAPP